MTTSLTSLFFIVSLFSTSIAWADVTQNRQQELIHLLKHDCGSCHGLTLRGGLGPPLTADALKDKSSAFLEEVVLYGVPKRAMPPWKDHLTSQEVLWLINRMKEGVE